MHNVVQANRCHIIANTKRRGFFFSVFFLCRFRVVFFVSCFFGHFFVFSCFLSIRNKKSVVCYKIVRYNREKFGSWISYMARDR